MKTNILIIGQGAIGTFLGAAFTAAGTEVTHYIRNPNKAAAIVELCLNDRRKTSGKIKKGTPYHYNIVTKLTNIEGFPFIFIPVSHNSWHQIVTTLQPLLQPHQTVVLSGNVWNDFDWLEQHIPAPFVYAFPNFGGAITNGQLQGWLTPNLTLGITNPNCRPQLNALLQLLRQAGFAPKHETDIQGWLMTHFAWNAGLLAEAARQNGFVNMTKSWQSLTQMYRLTRECMQVVNHCGIHTASFAEGRAAFKPYVWNALKTRLLFMLPGLAKSADTTKNLPEWWSYAQKVYTTAVELNFQAPLLSACQQYWTG